MTLPLIFFILNGMVMANQSTAFPKLKFLCVFKRRCTGACNCPNEKTNIRKSIQLKAFEKYFLPNIENAIENPHFTEIDQYRDVESLNYYKILREQGKSEAETLNILAQRSRDDGRTPMQWDSSPNAGFTSGTPWIGVADNYKSINAAAQTSDADSIYSFYKAMVRLRKEHRVISEGKIEFLYPDNTDLLAYRRYGSVNKEELLVLCNLTEQEIHAELPDAWATAEKLIGNYADNPSETLRPYECVVLHTTKE